MKATPSPVAKFRPWLPLLAALIPLAPHLPARAEPPPDPLAEQFAHPPNSAKPRTWWHWVSGNVSKEGITADLEAMKQIGLAGAQIFTVDQSAVKGPVKFLSPEWKELVRYALDEAARLHLEISMEGCDGWSESGGPWVTPAESMQKVVWTEQTVAGGRKVALDLPQPETVRGYYEDIALYALPAPEALPLPDKITASDPQFDGTKIQGETGSGTSTLAPTTGGQESWIRCEFAQPATFQSVRFAATREKRHSPSWEIQASDDGSHFRKIASAQVGTTVRFPAATARYFRLWQPAAPAGSGPLQVASLRFGGAALDKLEARSGMQVDMDANRFEDLAVPAGEVIDPKALVDLTGRHEWQAPPGRWTLLRLGHTSTGATTHPSTSGGLECDKLSAAAVQHSMETLFGPVFAGSPGLLGSTFKYILLDSWEAGCENWTPGMPAEFKRRRGYELAPWLPALAGKIVGSAERTQRFLWDYRRTLADLVAEHHYGTVQAFARAHGMGLMSEASGIGLPTVADQLLCKKYTDIPMGEFWVNQPGHDSDDPRETASAAHLYGQNLAATESFTATTENGAWKNDPYSLKALGDKEFCNGINRFVFHRYAHQPWLDRRPGMSMGPWGINFERTNTWWEPGRAWVEYLSRCQYLLQQGRFQADLCYYYGEGAPVGVRQDQLTPAPPQGWDYDVCNADILLNQMSVKDGRLVLPDGMTYRMLILPQTDRMTLSVLRKIDELVQAGATVYGPRPEHSPSLTDDPAAETELPRLATEVWGDCDGQTVKEHACGLGKIAWGEPLERALGMDPDFTSAGGDLRFIHRQTPDAEIYFISNQSQDELTTQAAFRTGGRVPELWHADTGEHEEAALYKIEKGRTTMPLHFDPSGSLFVIFREAAPAESPVSGVTLDGTNLWTANDLPPAGLPEYHGGKVEMTVFQSGTYAATSGGDTSTTAVAPLPKPAALAGPWQIDFPPKLGAPGHATFDNLVSWTDSKDDGIKYFSGTATYRKDFNLPAEYLASGRRVYLDLGQVKNLAEVSLNGKALGILWKPPFRVQITSAAVAGPNHLKIKVTNLWPNRLIGDEKLPKEQRITWASVSLYKADSPLLPSGLLGPVTIIPAQQISF